MSIRFTKETKKIIPLSGQDADVSTVLNWVDQSEGDTVEWSEKQEKWYKLRKRIKKAKNFPFPNASNIRMPTLDIKIRKIKAGLRSAVLGIRPIVSVKPSPSGTVATAKKIEKFLDHLVMDVMDIENKVVITADQMLEKGFFLNKPYWRLETTMRKEKFSLKDINLNEAVAIYDLSTDKDTLIEFLTAKYSIDTNKFVWMNNREVLEEVAGKIMSAKSEFEFQVEDILYNSPDVALVEPERLYVPASSGYHPQSCEYLIEEYYITKQELQAMSMSQGWDIENIDFIMTTCDEASDSLAYTKDFKEGISRLRCDNQVKIYECYAWLDLNGDGAPEKVVITIAPEFGKSLRKAPLSGFDGKFPFVKFMYELCEDRWFHHRGVPEQLEDIVKEIDVQHMQKIDQQTVRNAPMYLYRAGMINQSTTQFLFGQGIKVQGMQPLSDVMAPLNNSNANVEFSYDREQQILQAQIEELTGQVDFTLQSMINRREPRTAEEVALQNQSSANVFSLDTALFRKSFTELLRMIYALWLEYGEDEYEFNYFGQQNYETIKISKEELQNGYTINVRATDQNSNPQVRLGNAQLILNAIQNPIALQTGIVGPQNIYAAYQRLFQEMQIEDTEELISEPQPPAPSVPEDTIPKFKDLEEYEQAQVLERLGIKPDVGGRVSRNQREIANENIDNVTNLANALK